MIYLIGLGVAGDITLNGLEALKNCKKIYAENYTGILEDGWKEKLESLTGKKIEIIEREKVESDFILKEGEKDPIALLVPGDPLLATTHFALFLEAKKKGIDLKIIHNSSIFSVAFGIAGLQAYKFGKTATLAFWRENFKPTSSLEIVEENKKRGLHTLLLLDIDKNLGPMDFITAVDLIYKIEEKLNRKIINERIVVISRAGWKDEKISYGFLEDLKKIDVGKAPFSIIVPGNLHFLEEEALKLFIVTFEK